MVWPFSTVNPHYPPRVDRSRRSLCWAAPGVIALAASGAVLLWPLDGNGVTGTALRPTYMDFGWFVYAPLAEPNPSKADLRQAGRALPEDAVHQRRRASSGLALLGVVLLSGTAYVAWRRTGR